MKIFGALLTVCAAAAVIPYKINVNKEDKTVNAKGLIYDLNVTKDENGERDIEVNFRNPFKKENGSGSCCGKCENEDTFEDTEFTEVNADADEADETEETVTENPAENTVEE